jgi:hypothetical protein
MIDCCLLTENCRSRKMIDCCLLTESCRSRKMMIDVCLQTAVVQEK